jgi:radical SAM superfamily enzyme YgiQ (UPF0313 family)
MRITLIRPSFGHDRAGAGYHSPARFEPLEQAVLAALTPRRFDLRAYDERIEPVPFHEPTDLVGLSVCTFSAKRAYEVAQDYRSRGVTVVMGGYHPTLVPEEAEQHADAIVVGDAEHVWPRLLQDWEAGRLQKRYEPPHREPAIPIRPDRSIYAGKRYIPVRLVQFSRGCRRNCEFCAIRSFYAGGTCQRSIADMVDELRSLRAKRVFFVDDNIVNDIDTFKALLTAIIPLRLRWTTQIDIRFADDPEVVELAKRSGCQSLVIGFESLNEQNLRQMHKAWNKVPTYERQLARLRDAGIMIYGTFVFGYDADGPEVFDKTLEFAIRQGLYIANFNPLQPFPGTPLYERLHKEGRLAYERWWLSESYSWHNALIEPRGMTREQLSEGCHRCREGFNSTRAMTRRFFSSRAHTRVLDNAVVFWASNIVSRLDIKAKSGLRLGSSQGARP